MKTIGIVGGVGPYAGMQLFKNILDLTNAKLDQQHLPVLMHSLPDKISDRSAYLLGDSKINPAIAISKIITNLSESGAEVIGIPCNTAHADSIYKEVELKIPDKVKLLHQIEEVALYIKDQHPECSNIGILSTTGTFNTQIYSHYLQKNHLNPIQVTREIQDEYVHPSIYNESYGIKSNASPVSDTAKNNLITAIDYLIKNGAQVIILGCTELSLVFADVHYCNIPLIDSTKILARALILECSPESLLK